MAPGKFPPLDLGGGHRLSWRIRSRALFGRLEALSTFSRNLEWILGGALHLCCVDLDHRALIH